MLYNKYLGMDISRLGFGMMRLPLLPGTQKIDEEQTREMVKLAFEGGVNYFDTAYPYHGGMSEIVAGNILKDYPRDSYYLASKFPGHQIAQSYDPKAVFEEQLKKCRVDYFDFYLLHNVYENSLSTYEDERWGIIEYFKKQKELGRIKHLGFSTHGRVGFLKDFLDKYRDIMEFCQIQLNYLDWTLQDAKAKYELLTERGIGVWVMEPVRGGKLAKLDGASEKRLKAIRPDRSTASWAFEWLIKLPNVKVVLSGMSDIAQMKDNIDTFTRSIPLTDEEDALMLDIAETLKGELPCTSCRYCTEGCPMGLDIPRLINAYNDLLYGGGMNVGMQMETLPEDKLPGACIGCGACAQVCPQKIDIPRAMAEFSEKLAATPKWADICRERDEANRRAREGR